MSATAADVHAALEQLANPADASFLQRFFKTAPGQYGAGNVFLGIRVPVIRTLVKRFRDLPLAEVLELLHAREHEGRLLALLLMVDQYKRGSGDQQAALYAAYLDHTRFINNWDLVDSSAPQIVGAHLQDGDRSVLDRLARSDLLWERRIAMIATLHFIRQSDLEDVFRIAALLLRDAEDLMHKAVGWMLREAGKKDRAALDRFLDQHASVMPRTALRYAIEKHSPAERGAWLARPHIRNTTKSG